MAEGDLGNPSVGDEDAMMAALAQDTWMHNSDIENSVARNGGSGSVASSAAAVASSYPDLANMKFLQVIDTKQGLSERPMVAIYGMRMPNFKTYADQLISYIRETLDELVECDYDVVYFNYGTRTLSMNSFAFLKRAYSEFDRRYKKNIKRFYVVHPSRTMMLIYGMFKGFISKKFDQKLRVISSLNQLQETVRLETMNIPSAVKEFDSNRNMWSEFGKDLSSVVVNSNGVPYLISYCCKYLLANGAIEQNGIFRVSGLAANQQEMAKQYSISPQTFQFPPDTKNSDVCGLLKQFLRQLPHPIIASRLLTLDSYTEQSVKGVIQALPEVNQKSLACIFNLLAKVVQNKEINSMGSDNLAVCFAPSLCWSDTPNYDDIKWLKSSFEILITHYDSILGNTQF